MFNLILKDLDVSAFSCQMWVTFYRFRIFRLSLNGLFENIDCPKNTNLQSTAYNWCNFYFDPTKGTLVKS